MSQQTATEVADDGTALLDELRGTEFARLDAARHVYLDYTGASLYADSQLCGHLELLQVSAVREPSVATTGLHKGSIRDSADVPIPAMNLRPYVVRLREATCVQSVND